MSRLGVGCVRLRREECTSGPTESGVHGVICSFPPRPLLILLQEGDQPGSPARRGGRSPPPAVVAPDQALLVVAAPAVALGRLPAVAHLLLGASLQAATSSRFPPFLTSCAVEARAALALALPGTRPSVGCCASGTILIPLLRPINATCQVLREAPCRQWLLLRAPGVLLLTLLAPGLRQITPHIRIVSAQRDATGNEPTALYAANSRSRAASYMKSSRWSVRPPTSARGESEPKSSSVLPNCCIFFFNISLICASDLVKSPVAG